MLHKQYTRFLLLGLEKELEFNSNSGGIVTERRPKNKERWRLGTWRSFVVRGTDAVIIIVVV